MPTQSERFWSKVDKTGECWMWTGTVASGYGWFGLGGRGGGSTTAHRWAWSSVNGPIPEGMQIDHRTTCSKLCVNPDHLRLATPKQNGENRASTRATSGYRGVRLHRSGRWEAHVTHHGKFVSAGYFDTAEEAARAAANKRMELFTHNEIDRRDHAAGTV